MDYKTESNIQTAFGGESKANRRYTLFAEKAEKDDFPQAAKLFRAAAEAEMVHIRNHLKVIDAIGMTVDNLLAASLGEKEEFTAMYPAFIRKAREEMNDRAERSFVWANEVEKVHYDYFEAAYLDMKEGKPLADVTYYVCQVCGNTVKDNVPDKCPICGAPSSVFKKVE